MEQNFNDSVTPVELMDALELTTKQASARYGCDNYSTFHNRMNRLGIKPERRGRQSYLSQEQIQILDRLDIHLKSGGTIQEFMDQTGDTRPLQQREDGMELVRSTRGSIAPVGSVSGGIGDLEIISALQSLAMRNYDVLTPQKCLKEAVDNGFVVTTDQLSQILGLSKSSIGSWKSGTRRLGFVFHKEHENSSVVWRVTNG